MASRGHASQSANTVGRSHTVGRWGLLLMMAGLHAGLVAWLAQSTPPTLRLSSAPLILTVSLLHPPAPAPVQVMSPPPPEPEPLPQVMPPEPVAVAPLPEPKAQLKEVPKEAKKPVKPPKPKAKPKPAPPVASAPPQPQVPPAPVPVEPLEASLPVFNAAYLRNPSPEYPRLSRRLQEEGQVLLRVLVSAQGLPEAVEIQTSSGHSRLDKAALEAVRQWKFVPAKQGSQTVSAWVVVPVAFVLNS